MSLEKNEKGQLTARIVQEDADRTLALLDAPQMIVEKKFQASEETSQRTFPDWLKTRTPFSMSVAPGGKGALLLTMDAAFFVTPTQRRTNFATTDGQSQQIDLMEKLFDARAEKARYFLPEIVQNTVELTKESTNLGALLSIKDSIFSRSELQVDKETGDIWWIILGRGNGKIPSGHYLLRIKSPDLQNAPTISVAARLTDEKSRRAPSVLLKTIGDKRYLAMVSHNLLWLLDRESLQPVKLGSTKNPIDLNAPRFTSVCGDLTGDQVFVNLVDENSVDRPSVLVRATNSGDFKSAVRIDLLTGEIVESFKEPREEWNGVVDPYGEMTFKKYDVWVGGKVIKPSFTPLAVLRGRPWLVTRADTFLEFCDRENLASQVSIEVPQQLQDYVKHFQSPITLIKDDSPRDRLVVFFPDRSRDNDTVPSLWILPLADTKLPQKPMLVAGLKLPELIEPGKTLKIPLELGDAKSKVSLRRAPEGMTIEGNVLTWNPTNSHLGQHTIELDVSVGNETAPRSYPINVGFPSIRLSYPGHKLAVSENGKVLVVGGEKNMTIFDTESSKVIANQQLDSAIYDIAVNSQSVYVLLSEGRVFEYRLTDLANPVTHSAPAETKAMFIAKDRLLFFLRDHISDLSQGIRYKGVVQLPEFSETLKTKLLSESSDNSPPTAFVADTGELCAGEVVLDQRGEKVVSIHSMRWSKLRGLTPSFGHTGVLGNWLPSLTSSYQTDDSCSINLNSRCSVKFELKPEKTNPRSQLFLSARNGEIDIPRIQYTEFQGHAFVPRAVGTANLTAFLMSDHVLIIPLKNLGIDPLEPQQQAPLVLRSKDMIDTIALTGKQNVGFVAKGGKPPYTFQLNGNSDLLERALGPQQSKAQSFIQCNPKNGTVIIDGKSLGQALISRDSQWIRELVEEQSNLDAKRYQPSEAIVAYRSKVLEKLAPLAKGKINGVPLGLNLNISVTDSENKKVELSHCVVLDLPLAQIVKVMDPNF